MKKSFKREIVVDVETTGLSPKEGNRVIEIGCVELMNHTPSGRVFHQYINPEFEMCDEMIDVHGITNEFLSDKPVFAEIAQDFLDFIGSDSSLVAHHAPFDMKFLNSELSKLNLPTISSDRFIDTLVMAKKEFPDSRLNLEDLGNLFHIDKSSHINQGVLSDCELVADIYLKLLEK